MHSTALSKGRVERAIRYIRDRFFAARRFRSLDDLNEQARQWCETIALERCWPDDKRRTVGDVLAEERARLMPLPDAPFACEDRVEAVVGKTPYIRFDWNDYSVPHEQVGRTLVVAADDTTVRVLRGQDVVATHERSFDRGLQIEDPAHVESLVAAKSKAANERTADVLTRAAPAAEDLLAKVAERQLSLRSATRELLELLRTHGADALDRAIREALRDGTEHPQAVRHILERERLAAGRRPVLPLELPNDPRIRDLTVMPHDLRRYESLGDTRCHRPKRGGTTMTTTTTATATATTAPDPGDDLRRRAQQLGLYGLLANWSEVASQTWIERLLEIEEKERGRRSLERRIRNAKLRRFKPMADFDWEWPASIDRELIDDLFRLDFVNEPANVILVGPNGVGKTMIAKNLAHHAILSGHTAQCITASELLNDLAAQETSSALTRRLRHYVRPQILVIDEVGYLATSSEHADLLFEVVTRRYQEKPIILSTNRPFAEWNSVFPSASCVVTMIDRLVHKAEIVTIKGESYRLKEANERAEKRKANRKKATSNAKKMAPASQRKTGR